MAGGTFIYTCFPPAILKGLEGGKSGQVIWSGDSGAITVSSTETKMTFGWDPQTCKDGWVGGACLNMFSIMSPIALLYRLTIVSL
jgi:hypothetical protein